MITDEQRKRYYELREKGCGARSAFTYAKFTADARLIDHVWDLKDGRKVAWEEDGIEFRAEIASDDYPDMSWIGAYSDEWQHGAIDRFRGDSEKHRRRRELRYFVPGNTEAEHYKGLRGRGFTQGEAGMLAKKYVLEDFKRMESYGDDWCMTIVRVKAYIRGIELGSASLCGVESNSDHEYIAEILRDLASEAKHEALEALAGLKDAKVVSHG